MSTPSSLELPDGAARITVDSARGTFAALEALPAAGPCEHGTALLIPGYTGSKEDFIAVLGQLAAAGRRVVAIDMRGQYETPGPDSPAAYGLAELGADITAVARATGAMHLLGHSFGGLVARKAVLGGWSPASLTLMSSGPAALPGTRAGELRAFLDLLDGTATADLSEKISKIWLGTLKPQAVAAGAAGPIVDFLAERMLASNPTGLVTMAGQLLAAGDETSGLAARAVPTLVLYGENDDAWPADQQLDMAVRLNAERACIPAASHSPNVEAPATTAHALTTFWDASEARLRALLAWPGAAGMPR